MFDVKCCNNIWTAIFTYLGTLSWPIVVLIIVCVLRQPLANLISRIKKVEVAGWKFEIGDIVLAFSPKDKVYYSIPLELPAVPAMKPAKAEVARLSDEEIEQSRQKALKRLEEDVKTVGYQRGKLIQTKTGKWAISWDLEVSDKVILKDSAGK